MKEYKPIIFTDIDCVRSDNPDKIYADKDEVNRLINSELLLQIDKYRMVDFRIKSNTMKKLELYFKHGGE
jgi:hypothetical protein